MNDLFNSSVSQRGTLRHRAIRQLVRGPTAGEWRGLRTASLSSWPGGLSVISLGILLLLDFVYPSLTVLGTPCFVGQLLFLSPGQVRTL